MKIALIPNFDKDSELTLTHRLIDVLFGHGCTVMMEESCRGKMLAAIPQLASKDARFCGRDTLFGEADAICVLGGDGFILKAARSAAVANKPLLGVNLGRVGYIAELEISELDMIGRVISGDYEIENRFMLEVEVIRDGRTFTSFGPVLNDAVISNSPVPRLLNFDIYCDMKIAGSFRADGVVVATPTGSTAYSMSAGGPVLDPKLHVVCVTPVSSHSLSSRPFVLSGQSVIEISGFECRGNDIWLTADGRDSVKIDETDTVKITPSKHTTKLIRLKERGFINMLRIKLS
jgi:NAD+ kinase